MRRLMLDETEDDSRSFHQCERRDCNRVFGDHYGYSDFVDGQFRPLARVFALLPHMRSHTLSS